MFSSAKIVKEIRKAYDLTKKEFSEILELSETAISNYEKGLRRPKIEIIMRLKKLAKKVGLNYETDDFLK